MSKVPSGWRNVSVGDICEFKYGKSLPAGSRLPGGHPVYGSNGIVGSHNVPLTSGPTIVVGRKGSLGEVAYSPGPCWPIDTTYFVDSTSTAEDLRWLSRRLSALGLTELNRAAAVPGLNREDAYRKRLLLPPIEEQRRIAEVLDRADELRAKRREALTHLDNLTQSMFLDMFGHPATNPQKLRVARIGHLTQVGTGGTPPRESAENYGGDIPWVKTAEVDGGRITATEERITEAGRRSARCRVYPQESIVIALYGQGRTRGQCAILDIEATTNQACAVLPPTDHFDSTFLFHQIKLSYARLRSLGRGGNQANLNLGLVSAFEVLLPPIEEQRRFARQATAVEAQRKHLLSSMAQLDALFASLQERAFRGGL